VVAPSHDTAAALETPDLSRDEHPGYADGVDTPGRRTARRRVAFGLALQCMVVLLLGLATLPSVAAQDFPSHPITIIVAFPAGGPTDLIARLVAEHMTLRLDQPVVIENISGAGGTIGAARVARAAPDGYTLLVHQLALAAGASLYAKLPYDTLEAFEGVGLINYAPMVIVGRKSLPAQNLSELIALMRGSAAPMTFAQSGFGTPAHLSAILFIEGIGAQVTDVPYRGGRAALNDVIAEQVDLFCSQSLGVIELIRAGTIKGFAVTSLERLPALPTLPTLDESGFKGLETIVWHGLFAPRGTPAPVIARLNGALRAALGDRDLIERFAATGSQLFPPDRQTPAAAKRLLVDDVAKWGKVIRDHHISRE
jgi:tripartite-type tricarboxylate transporter receptor subunit TctC